MRQRIQRPGARRGLRLLRTAVGLCAVLTLCFTGAHADEIAIGALYPLTGPAAELGAGNRIGAEFAVKEINEAGGVGGRRLRLVIEDSKSDPGAAVSALRKLLDSDRVSFVLTTLTSVSMAIRPITERQQVLVLAESAHPDLTKSGKLMFRNFMTVDAVNDVVVEFAKPRSIRRLAVLHAEEDWGQAALDDLVARQADSSLAVVAGEAFPKTATDLKPQILKLLAKHPEAIYVVGYGPAAALAYRQLAEAPVNVPVLGYLVCGQPDVLDSAKNAKLTVNSVDMDLDRDSPALKRLLAAAASARSGRTGIQQVVTGYDAVRILGTAIEAVGDDTVKVRDYILKQRRFEGASGTIEFSDTGDARRKLRMLPTTDSNCGK